MQKRRMAWLLLLIVVSVLGLGACGNREGSISGRVTAGKNGPAVAAARVAIYSLNNIGGSQQTTVYQKGTVLQEQVTDEKGMFRFSVQPGTYVVQVWMDEQKVGDQMITVKPGRSADATFEVELPSP